MSTWCLEKVYSQSLGKLSVRDRAKKGKDGKLVAKKVIYVEVFEDIDGDRSWPVYGYDSGRVITLSKFSVSLNQSSLWWEWHPRRWVLKKNPRTKLQVPHRPWSLLFPGSLDEHAAGIWRMLNDPGQDFKCYRGDHHHQGWYPHPYQGRCAWLQSGHMSCQVTWI